MSHEETVFGILISWIKSRSSFPSHEIETELPVYGVIIAGKQHTPGTYSRIFRMLKNSNMLTDAGIALRETGTSRNKTYIVQRMAIS